MFWRCLSKSCCLRVTFLDLNLLEIKGEHPHTDDE